MDGTTTIFVDGQSASVSVTGNGIEAFQISPTSFDFGNVPTGSTSSSQEVTITNVSGTSQTPNFAGGGAGVFGGAQNCAGRTLAPGQSCIFRYRFKPTDVGPVDGTTTIFVDSQSASISFTGTGLEPFLISPLAFDFGEIEVGNTSSPQDVTITNISGASQTPTFAGGGAGVFGGAQNCAGRTLAADESCIFRYRFTPTDDAPVTGSTTIFVDDRRVDLSFIGNGPVPTPVLGDLNDDGVVDAADYSLFRSTLGKCTGDAGYIAEADYDGDGCITYADYRIWYGYFKNQ